MENTPESTGIVPVLEAGTSVAIRVRILQGTQIGYNTVMRHSIVIAKVSDAQQQLAEAKAQLEALQAQKDALECEHAALLYASLTGEVL
jgi:hypothetical protein